MGGGLSRNEWDEEDQQNEHAEETPLAKDLRKQLKAKDAEAKTMAEELSKLKAAERKRSLAEVLKSKGVNEKVAAFYPVDAETTAEAVAAWVTENSDVFGVAPAEPQEPAVDAETVAGLKAISGAGDGAAPDPAALGLLAQVNATDTREALEALIAGAHIA